MRKTIIGFLLTFIFISCQTKRYISHHEYKKNYEINNNITENIKIKNTINPFKLDLEKKMNIKISYTNINLTKEGTNNHLGNILADFTFQTGNEWLKNNKQQYADAAIINIGGIRATIAKGDILIKNMYEVMPFENEVVIVKLSGKDMHGLFEYYKKTKKNDPVSGITLEITNEKITKALIQGKNIEAERDYYIVTSDYLAQGGDAMTFFSKGQIINTGIKLRDAFIEKFSANNPLKFKEVEERLNFYQSTKQ